MTNNEILNLYNKQVAPYLQWIFHRRILKNNEWVKCDGNPFSLNDLKELCSERNFFRYLWEHKDYMPNFELRFYYDFTKEEEIQICVTVKEAEPTVTVMQAHGIWNNKEKEFEFDEIKSFLEREIIEVFEDEIKEPIEKINIMAQATAEERIEKKDVKEEKNKTVQTNLTVNELRDMIKNHSKRPEGWYRIYSINKLWHVWNEINKKEA